MQRKKAAGISAVSSVTPALSGGCHATESIGADVSWRRFYGIPRLGGMYPDLTQSVKLLKRIQFLVGKICAGGRGSCLLHTPGA